MTLHRRCGAAFNTVVCYHGSFEKSTACTTPMLNSKLAGWKKAPGQPVLNPVDEMGNQEIESVYLPE